MTKSSLLQISPSDACLGMFIHGFGKHWMSSPFAHSQFKLTSPAELKALRESSVGSVLIDLSKGVGPGGSMPAPPKRLQPPHQTGGEPTLTQATGLVRSVFAKAASPAGVDRQQVDAVVDVVDQLISTRPTAILTLTRLKTKDETSFQHSIAVCALVGIFARHLKLEGKLVRILSLGGLLHDIGKVRIPTTILTKSGPLTAHEIAVMQGHPRTGHDMLVQGGALPPIVGQVCLHHHEKLDGSGYPDGLKGDQIGAAARIVAICDVFDALTSVRPYKKGFPAETAVAMMSNATGQFDQRLLRKFVDCMGLQWPDGSTPVQPADGGISLSQPDMDDFRFDAPAVPS